jgi:hypothetical protein
LFGASGYIFFVCHWGGAGKKAGGRCRPARYSASITIYKKEEERKKEDFNREVVFVFREELRKWLRFNYSSLS